MSPIRLVRGTACLGLAIDDQKTAEFVQNPPGVSRYNNVYRETLDRVVDRLVAEADAVRK